MQLGLAWDDDHGEDLVRNMLKPHTQVIADAILTSWKKYMEVPDEKRFPWISRTRANVVHDYICHEIRHKFDGVQGISIIEDTQFLILNFSDIVLVRFKLLDKNLRAGNIQTKQQRDYDNQLELPNLPPKAYRVIAGYQLDKAQVAVKDILIVRPVRKRTVWSYSILNENISALHLPFTKDDNIETEQPQKRRVKPKNPGKSADSKELDKSEKLDNNKELDNLEKLDDSKENKSKRAQKRRIKPKNLEKPGESDGEVS